MSFSTRLRSLWRNLLSKEEADRDLDEELRTYVDLAAAEKVRAGMAPDEARRAALGEVGGIEDVKESVRDVRTGASLDTLLQDLRSGGRLLRRAPAFAAIAILTIALGIGANSAIFSVLNGIILKPLGYPNPEQLMFLTSQFPTLGFDRFWISPPEYFELRERSRAFSDVAAYATGQVNLNAGDQPERVNSVSMTANMFGVLGVRPMLGRGFTPEEDRPNAEPVVVISHDLWRRAFGADPRVIGQMVEIQGRRERIVGVAPPGFDLHDARAQTWRPLGLDPAAQNRGNHFLYLVGRLRPDVTQAQAEGEMRTLLRQWGELNPGTHVPNDSTHRLQMTPLHDDVIGNVKSALWVLQGAVVLVLLIACANVANLLLARAESRNKEFAIRTALGAGRWRILRQFMAEGLVLATLGAALGLLFADWGLQLLLAANPGSIPRAAEVGLDPLVVAFTAVLALLTAAIFGLAPLLHLDRDAVATAIKEGGARTTSTVARGRVRRTLVVAEIALAVMLVIGAGLLIRSFRNLTSVDAGFDPANLVTFGLVLPPASYPEPQRRAQFLTGLLERLEQIPGVEQATAMSGLPPFRNVNANDTDFENYTAPPGSGRAPENVDYYQTVMVDYFDAMGIRILQGRGFGPGDVGGTPVVVVNQTLAETFFPDEDPIGRRLRPGFGDAIPWLTIVGVAEDVKQGGLDAEVGTEIYFSYEQGAAFNFVPSQMNVAIRSPRALDALAPGIRRAVADMDPGLPIVQLRTVENVFSDSVARQRFLSLLLGIFAAVALALAAIGTYGILSYMVTERRREIGIRMALGADRGRVMRLVLGHGLVMAGIGIAIGLVGAFALSRLTASLLYGVSPADPLTFSAVAGIIAAVAVVACLLPTRRATRVDPLVAMRAE